MSDKLVPVSPNSHHFATIEGRSVMQPGLGADEPSEKQRIEAAAAAEKYRLQEDAIKSAQAEVEKAAEEVQRQAEEQARLAEERTVEFERRMAELDARERALEDKEKKGSTT